MNDVSIVVVVYNAGSWVQKCLTAVAEHESRYSTELIVIDNASTEFGAAELRRWAGENAVIERLPENVGFARACNRAGELSSGRFILLLNPDAILSPGTVDALVDLHESSPRIGIVGGRVTGPSGELDRGSCWGFQTVPSLVMFASGLSTVFPRSPFFNPEGLGAWERDTARRVDVVTGCLLLVDRSLWHSLEGFDPDFFMYGEDADLCQRARQLGAESWITPDAHVVHALGASSSSTLGKQQMLFRGKATLVRKKSASRLATAVSLVLLQSGVGLRALGERVTGRDRAAWMGLWISRREWRRGWPSCPTSNALGGL